MKYLFGYKPGVVISEQDKIPVELRRRLPLISKKFDKALNNPENDPNDFGDEFGYVDSVLREAIDSLMEEDDDYYSNNEYEIID